MNIDRVKTLSTTLQDIASRALGVVALYHGFTYDLIFAGNSYAIAGSVVVCTGFIFAQKVEDCVERVCTAWVASKETV